MKANKFLPFKSSFNDEELSILEDYLDTYEGQIDNTLKSYIKINIVNLISFINKNTKEYKKSICVCEAVETLMETLDNFRKDNYKFLALS